MNVEVERNAKNMIWSNLIDWYPSEPNKATEYRIAGNFSEAEIFVIFVIKCQVAKISSPKSFPDKLRNLSALPSSVVSRDTEL